MPRLLNQAIEAVKKLPESDQNALASILLEEIEAERRWDELFARPESADLLSRKADQALSAARAGSPATHPINWLGVGIAATPSYDADDPGLD